jgi:hypothetical protein
MTERGKQSRKRPGRRGRLGRREEDPTFAGAVVGFVQAVREMVFGSPPLDAPPDEGGLAGSRVPRRSPDKSGPGSVALAEPIVRDDELEDEAVT